MQLKAVGLAKAFGATQALRSCTFTLSAGEVHTIVGENGSGKSTLVKILTGILAPDRGAIEVDGLTMSRLRGPRAALAAGIVGVFQQTLLAGDRPVLDNLWLGTDGVFRRRRSESARRALGAEVLSGLLGAAPNLDAPAASLSLSERQACTIARALLRDPHVLILDESTSALDMATRKRLFTIIRRLAEAGKSVVFISHRLDEVEEISDVVTVLRAGETVATVRRGEVTSRELVRLMTGVEQLSEGQLVDARERVGTASTPAVIVRDLVLRSGARPIDASIRAGELLGIAGLEGHGQERFLHALAGARPLAGNVSVGTSNGPVSIVSRVHAMQHGVAYVPRDRHASGVFESLSIRDNFALPTLAQDRRAGLLSTAKTVQRLSQYVKRLSITFGRSGDEITTLSGGNQQKIVLARWLAAGPRVLLLNDPTRGIDPGAKRDLHRILAGLAGEGVAVVMLSTDVDELVELMDRVLVFREGEVFAELPGDRVTRHALMASFFGRRPGVDV